MRFPIEKLQLYFAVTADGTDRSGNFAAEEKIVLWKNTLPTKCDRVKPFYYLFIYYKMTVRKQSRLDMSNEAMQSNARATVMYLLLA